jgi:hypothetical protein
MLKKCVIVLALLALLAGQVYAGQIVKELANETLSSSNTDTGWIESNLADSKRVSFFVTMDSSSTTTAVTTQVTAQVSADGTNWTDIKWSDLAGGTTAQVTETISGDGTYLMWLDSNIPMPYVRIKVLTEKASAWPADSAAITVNLVEEK